MNHDARTNGYCTNGQPHPRRDHRDVAGQIDRQLEEDSGSHFGVEFRRNNFGARDRVFDLRLAASNADFEAYEAKTIRLIASLERQSNIIWRKRWTWGVATELLATDERGVFDDPTQKETRTFLIGALPLNIAYDEKTGAHKATTDVRTAGVWARIVDAFTPLHFGNFGGLPVKILWCIGGLTPGALAVTGSLIWWNRRKSRRLDKRPLAPGRILHTGAAPASSRTREEASVIR